MLVVVGPVVPEDDVVVADVSDVEEDVINEVDVVDDVSVVSCLVIVSEVEGW